jgi:ABC-type sugar transport system permease subunit
VALGVTDGPINILDHRARVLPALIVVNVWKEFPFAMLMMLAGLQTVPDQLLRAAQVDGASTWQRFWHVTMPHLRGVSLVTVLLLLVTNLNSFTIPWIMTGGGPAGASEIWITHIYQQEPRLSAEDAEDPEGRDRPPGPRGGEGARHRASARAPPPGALRRSAAARRAGARAGP